jgi:hypothetical protein
MMDSALICQDDQRRHEVRRKESNGLDYLEVSDDQLKLKVYLLGKAPKDLLKENVTISGGRRIRDLQVLDLEIEYRSAPDLDDCLIVTVDKPGDFSNYSLCLVGLDESGRPTDKPFPGFDPRYACLEFNFKDGCPSDLDCMQPEICPPANLEEPEIDYLAKDYASFRQLILDRLAFIMPNWQERHVPDLSIALVELLAYTGDQLSYYQDAVATEAYLDTARQRVSVRRHARLVDYQVSEGCNARAWLFIKTDSDVELPSGEISFITGISEGAPAAGQVLAWEDLRNLPSNEYMVFEPLVAEAGKAIKLRQAHNEISFYTWGEKECCLERGATSASLTDSWVPVQAVQSQTPEKQKARKDKGNKKAKTPAPELAPPERTLDLKVGDILIFEEVFGPKTHNPADADPSHRHAVRLTNVELVVDPLYDLPVVEISWAEEDALPFPLCISSVGPAPNCEILEGISVARGNVILVDHGRRIESEPLGAPAVASVAEVCGNACCPPEVVARAGKFRPKLRRTQLTFSQLPQHDAPAAGQLIQDPRQALPQLKLANVPPAPDRSTALFSLEQLANQAGLESLVTWLTKREDARSSYLFGLLSAETKQLLIDHDPAKDPSDTLLSALTANLRLLLKWWTPRRDLLASSGDHRHFVVEMGNDRHAHLRFGDDKSGMKPAAAAEFYAAYRIGNGSAGNIGAEAISHVVSRQTISGVSLQPRNPMPASGGAEPERMEDVKLIAPHAFRQDLQRAITADDYAHIVMRDFPTRVQRAAAALRWMGSWYEVLVAIDPRLAVEADPDLLAEIKGHLYQFRRIGHDIAVAPARYVPLNIELIVCVEPDYLRGQVKAALLRLFSNRLLGGGQRGFFHPDNMSFGEGVYLSKIVAAAQAVPGVESIVVARFERLFEGPNREIENGILPLSPLEVARVDNDPSFAENGQLTLDMRGGR